MRARQRERGVVMIERRRNPRRRGMAGLALRGDAGLHVIRARCSVEIAGVAAEAICRRPRKFSIDVAGGAIKRRMRPGKREAGHFQVIELGAKP